MRAICDPVGVEMPGWADISNVCDPVGVGMPYMRWRANVCDARHTADRDAIIHQRPSGYMLRRPPYGGSKMPYMRSRANVCDTLRGRTSNPEYCSFTIALLSSYTYVHGRSHQLSEM